MIRFGVNYVPSKQWWYSWMDWNPASILEDLQAIRSLGMDHIRIHCLWPIFQPNPNCVSETALNRLYELLDIADECLMDVQITVLNGWLSGFSFYPAWKGDKNLFTNREMITAEKFLFKEIAHKVMDHPRFMGFDLGNEINVLTWKGDRFSIEEGNLWQQEIMSFCELIAPGKFHVNGVDHNPWFSDQGFSRDALASAGSATTLHTWVKFTEALSLYGWNGTGSLHLAEYCIELSKAYSLDLDRPIWLQELGASSLWMPPEQIPEFLESSILNAASCSNLWGITWWCSHDIDQRFSGFDPLEYDLGLLDIHNQVKPNGKRLMELIAAFTKQPPSRIERKTALVMPNGILSKRVEDPPGWQFAKHYMKLVEQGSRPAIVLQCRTGDEDYLNKRGIERLISLEDME